MSAIVTKPEDDELELDEPVPDPPVPLEELEFELLLEPPEDPPTSPFTAITSPAMGEVSVACPTAARACW